MWPVVPVPGVWRTILWPEWFSAGPLWVGVVAATVSRSRGRRLGIRLPLAGSNTKRLAILLLWRCTAIAARVRCNLDFLAADMANLRVGEELFVCRANPVLVSSV